MAARFLANRATASFIAAVIAALVVTACGDHAPSDTAETLARDPVRLKIALHDWTDPARMDDKICAAASEAWRRRFFEYKKMGEPRRLPEAPAPSDPPAEPTPWMAGS